VYETDFPDDAQPITDHPEPEPVSAQQVPSRTPAKSKPELQEAAKHTSAGAPKAVPRPRPVSKPANKVAPLPVPLPCKSPAVDTTPPAVHASVFGESGEELSELSDESASKPVAKVRLRAHSAQKAKAKPAPSLSQSDSIPPLPVTRRTAKRRLVVDSDEEIQATPKAIHRAAAEVPSSKQVTKAKAMPTELVKTHRIHTRRSSTLRSSSTLEDADHAEKASRLALQKPSTPSSDKTIHPEPVSNVAKPAQPRLSEDAFLMEALIPTAELLPEAIMKPASPAKKDLVAEKVTTHRVPPARPASSPNVPAKLAGTRRKREHTNSPTGVPVALLDDDHPPRKKARNTAGGSIEIKRDREAGTLADPFELPTSTTTRAKNTKKYGKKGKVSSPISPTVMDVDFDEVPGAGPKGKTNRRAKATTRASKPVPKKLPARQTRASAMRRKDGKPAELESPKGISSKPGPSEPEVQVVIVPRPADPTTEVVSPNNEVNSDLLVFFKPESTSGGQADKVSRLLSERLCLSYTRTRVRRSRAQSLQRI
jgi:hypothetical protein